MQKRAKSHNQPTRAAYPVTLWDLPTRLFHWLLVVLIAVSYTTGKIGGSAMQYHLWSGYTIMTLLLFRLVWGFIGGHPVRFASFLRGPRTVWQYARTLLRSGYSGHLGHNPLGGWSIAAMLLTLLLQVVTGLFANDEIFTQGPLYPWVSDQTSRWLTRVHRINQQVIMYLIGLHVMAVLFYLLVKRDNLITPMITGVKPWHAPVHIEKPRLGAAVVVAALSAAAVYLLVWYGG
ncbi:MAG: hypothetical protein VR64_23180 [Desulfatitalea sp. BRH_c12]|nr:MAG: hypothetical protein VR64_23180 [Desulfatitalea sp. BRH_c12]